MATATEELILNVLDTRFEDFGDEAIEDAKKRLIDIAGVAISGANAPGNSILLDLVRGWGGSKEATVLVHGDKVPLHNAAMLNSIMARSYDHEVTGPSPEGKAAGRMTGHICGTTDCTALSVAEHKGSSGQEVIAAVILGGDLAARIAVAGDFDFEHSFDLTGTVNAFGAAAVAGRLWGLNESQMRNALGILVNQIAGSFQCLWDGVHAFKLHEGVSARNAIIAVEMASKGFTGIKDPLLGPRGYFSLYCKSYHPEFLTGDLGKVFYVKGQHKKHPSCYSNHNTIDCGLELVQKYNMNIEDIDEVTLGVSQITYNGFLNQPFKMGESQPRALFNLPYAVANVLLRKGARLEHYTDKFIHDPRAVELAGRVKLMPAQPPENAEAVDMKVKMKDGKEFSASRHTQPRGWLENPLTKEEIREKFRANVEFSQTVSRKNAEKALAMLENLEEIDRIDKIVKLLVA